MLNALLTGPQLRGASVQDAFVEPQIRQRVLNALIEMTPLGPRPTTSPGNGWEITPSTGPGQMEPDANRPFALEGDMQSRMAGYEPRYGGRRPNPGGPEVTNAVRQAAVQTFGPGTTVVGISGTGEHGSPRHRASASGREHGYALDFQVRLPDGNLLSLDNPRARDFALNAARLGVSGMGAGGEYMGNTTFHMDTFPLDRYSANMGRAWGSWGDQIEQDFINAYRPLR